MVNANEIMKFFIPEKDKGLPGPIKPKAIGDFIKTLENKDDANLLTIANLCNKLEHEGLLASTGAKHGYGPILCNTYYCFNFNQKLADYGTYNFLLYGFPYIRSYFEKSVRPILIKYEDGRHNEYDIGTYFTLGDNVAITAKHCLPRNSLIQLRDENNAIIEPSLVLTPKDPDIDLAIILTRQESLKGLNHLKLGFGQILEEVITIGYPTIPGFEAIQIADNVVLTAETKSTTGRIIGQENSYLDRQNYFLINARVKGGNSGGPLINKKGEVVGVIAQLPQESDKIDMLGYGIATTSKTIADFFRTFQDEKTKMSAYQPDMRDNGFVITKGI